MRKKSHRDSSSRTRRTTEAAEPRLRRRLSAQCGHLQLGRLAVYGLAGVLDGPLEGLPGLADDLLVGGDSALGGHAKGVGLKGHVSGELTLALRGAVEADRTTDIFVPLVAGRFGRRIASFSD